MACNYLIINMQFFLVKVWSFHILITRQIQTFCQGLEVLNFVHFACIFLALFAVKYSNRKETQSLHKGRKEKKYPSPTPYYLSVTPYFP